MTNNIALSNSNVGHYGSAVFPPVSSSIQLNGNEFVSVEGVKVITTENKIDTPSHIYDYDGFGNPLFHSHSNQVIDSLNQDFVYIENKNVIIEGDKHTAEDTRVINSTQTFVKIN